METHLHSVELNDISWKGFLRRCNRVCFQVLVLITCHAKQPVDLSRLRTRQMSTENRPGASVKLDLSSADCKRAN